MEAVKQMVASRRLYVGAVVKGPLKMLVFLDYDDGVLDPASLRSAVRQTGRFSCPRTR